MKVCSSMEVSLDARGWNVFLCPSSTLCFEKYVSLNLEITVSTILAGHQFSGNPHVFS